MFIENRKIMGSNITKYMEQKGVTAKQMCEDLGIAPATLSDWRNGKTYPRIDKIELMANYFGCQKSDLVEDPDRPCDYLIRLNDHEYAIIESYRQMNDSGQSQLFERSKELLKLGYLKRIKGDDK